MPEEMTLEYAREQLAAAREYYRLKGPTRMAVAMCEDWRSKVEELEENDGK